MAYAYSEFLERTQHWARCLVDAGYLSPQITQPLLELDMCAPEPVFDDIQRPLIVAFMGGTGVGKSALLNRLAGQALARSGIERPTSREVTVYLYHGISIRQLPDAIPLDSLKVVRHEDDRHRAIVWIDMPDFDSIELTNRSQVLQWLPYIDVLIYVVSPERYRDHKAWQLLLSEGAKHAWLFVMNQWDRGLPVQFDDFGQQLAKAGFNEPLLFRTSCTEPAGDDFDDLVQQLRILSEHDHVVQLEQHQQGLRYRQLQRLLNGVTTIFSQRDYSRLEQPYQMLWQRCEQELLQGLAWPLQRRAQMCMTLDDNSQNDNPLWDAWAQNRFDDALDELVQQAALLHLPVKPLRDALQGLKQRAAEQVNRHSELLARQALLKPGNGVQRCALKMTAICEALLPLLAMAVVGYQVFVGYYHGAEGSAGYLGSDFAIHSVLLIGLSWLVPFFLHQKLQPSLEKTAFKGLQKGLCQALLNIDAEIVQILRDEQRRNTEYLEYCRQIELACQHEQQNQPQQSGVLERLLLSPNNRGV